MADPSPIDSVNKPISFSLSFNNAPLPISLEIYSITVQKAVNKIGRAQVQILGGDPNMNSFEEAEADYFEPGNPVEIKLGYDQSNTTVFKGIVEKNYVSIRDGFNRLKFKRLLAILFFRHLINSFDNINNFQAFQSVCCNRRMTC